MPTIASPLPGTSSLLLPLDELRAPSGCRPILELTVDGKRFQNSIISWDFQKDVQTAAGSGNFEIFFTEEVFNFMKQQSEFLLKAGWRYRDGHQILKEFTSGTLENVTLKNYNINIEYKDLGKKLEESITCSYTQKKRSFIITDLIKRGGLKPVVDFTGVKDDVIDFSSEQSSGGAGGSGRNPYQTAGLQLSCRFGTPKMGSPPANASTISGKGYPASACVKIPWEQFEFEWVNYCPACGKSGTLCSTLGPGGQPGGMRCCEKKGGCTADYCAVSGLSLECFDGRPNAASCKPGCGHRLTAAGGNTTTGGTGTDTTSTGAVPVDASMQDTAMEAPTSNTTSTSQGRTIWDMIIELCDPAEHDLQVFVWMDKCYVQRVPDPNTAKLWIDEELNLILDSPNIKEGDPKLPNTVEVLYTHKANPPKAVARNQIMADKYGPILEQHKKYDFGQKEAQNFADRRLGIINRDGGFTFDASVLGHPDWYIGRWTRTRVPLNLLEDIYYITRIAHKISAGSTWTVDGTFTEYRETIETGGGKGDDTTGDKQSILDRIGKEESRFGSVQGHCSRASCYEREGTGNCWADAEWLYNKLNAAGIPARIMGNRGGSYPRHTWIEINMGSGWTTYPYAKYGSKHTGVPSGVGRVFVLIKEGGTNAHISGV